MADISTLQEHAAAVLALLYAEPDLTVYPTQDGSAQVVPNGAAPPYVSVHLSAIRGLGGRLDHRSTRIAVRIYCHCAGANDEAARKVSDLVAATLLDQRPVIAGRSVYPIRNEVSLPPDTNDSAGRTVVTITDTYRLESQP